MSLGRASQTKNVSGSMLGIFKMKEARMNGVDFKEGCKAEYRVKQVSQRSDYMES